MKREDRPGAPATEGAPAPRAEPVPRAGRANRPRPPLRAEASVETTPSTPARRWLQASPAASALEGAYRRARAAHAGAGLLPPAPDPPAS